MAAGCRRLLGPVHGAARRWLWLTDHVLKLHSVHCGRARSKPPVRTHRASRELLQQPVAWVECRRAGTRAYMVEHAWHIRHGDGERLRLKVGHGVVVAGLQHVANLPHSCSQHLVPEHGRGSPCMAAECRPG